MGEQFRSNSASVPVESDAHRVMGKKWQRRRDLRKVEMLGKSGTTVDTDDCSTSDRMAMSKSEGKQQQGEQSVLAGGITINAMFKPT